MAIGVIAVSLQERKKSGVWLGVIIGAVVAIGGLLIAIALGGGGGFGIFSSGRVSFPPSRPVDKDRFLGNFQNWVTLSRFSVNRTTEKTSGSDTNSHMRVAWEFQVECDVESHGQRAAENLIWVIEVFQGEQLADVLKFPFAPKQINKGATGQLLSRKNSHIQLDPRNRQQPNFYTYVARKGNSQTRVPVSGIMVAGGPSSSSVPVAFGHNVRKKFDMIRLSNPVLKRNQDDQDDDVLSFDFEVIDESLLMDFMPGKHNSRTPVYYINIENKYGAKARYYGVLNDSEIEKRTIDVRQAHSFNEFEKGHFRRMPLRIYITREVESWPRKSSVLKPVDMFSNVLELQN